MQEKLEKVGTLKVDSVKIEKFGKQEKEFIEFFNS